MRWVEGRGARVETRGEAAGVPPHFASPLRPPPHSNHPSQDATAASRSTAEAVLEIVGPALLPWPWATAHGGEDDDDDAASTASGSSPAGSPPGVAAFCSSPEGAILLLCPAAAGHNDTGGHDDTGGDDVGDDAAMGDDDHDGDGVEGDSDYEDGGP